MEKKITYKKRTNLFKTDAWKRFSKNKLALIGSVIILLMIAAAILAPLIVQNDPYVSLTDANGLILKNSSPAKSGTILGTDSLGRDTFSRVIYAARVSMSVGVVAVGISDRKSVV